MPDVLPTPAELRAERGRRMIPVYRLAARIDMHPSHLGRMLREQIPMPAEVVRTLRGALAAGRDGR